LIEGFRDRRETIPEAFIWRLASQLVKAVHFIQNPPPSSTCPPLIYADIKPENVFLAWPDERNHNQYPTVQLGDFGLALPLHGGQVELKLSSFTGTAPFAAPEQIKQHIYSLKTDVWGIGSVLYTTIHFIPPIQKPMLKTLSQTRRYQEALAFYHQRDTEEMTAETLGLERRINCSWRANNTIPRVAKECPSNYSIYLSGLLKNTLRTNRNERPSMVDLFKSVLEHEDKVRDVMFSPLPTWFRVASRNSLAEAQKDKLVKGYTLARNYGNLPILQMYSINEI
jgi:serine/threonine protein kinase